MALIVNGGTVILGKSGLALGNTSSPTPGLTVNANGTVVINSYSQQIASGNGGIPNPVKLYGGAYDLNGFDQTVDSLLMTNGATLRNSADYATLTVGPVGGRTLTIGGTNCTFDVPGAELDIAAVVAGNGSLLKTGTGLLNLMNNTTYTGNTIISVGTLQINYPSLATDSTISIATNAMLNLNFANGETNTVASLVIDGVTYPGGVYSASTDPTYIVGTGSLLVVPLAPPINPLPGTIQVNVSGSTLALSWPTNLGWILQSQTNPPHVGLINNSSAWFDVPGSELVTSTNMPINHANGSVFYQMIHP